MRCQTAANGVLELEVSGELTGLAVKCLLREQLGQIPAELAFSGVTVEDHVSLEEMGVANGALLDVITTAEHDEAP